MSVVRFTALAAQDLEEIYDYIAIHDKQAAFHLIERLTFRWQTLSQNPGTGRKRDELLPSLRSATEGNYLIFYTVIDKGIMIIRVLHAARDLETTFKQGS